MRVGIEAASAAGATAFLETTNSSNVGLYESEGWRLESSLSVDQLDVRLMRHS
jgi:hypothetical protein